MFSYFTRRMRRGGMSLCPPAQTLARPTGKERSSQFPLALSTTSRNSLGSTVVPGFAATNESSGQNQNIGMRLLVRVSDRAPRMVALALPANMPQVTAVNTLFPL